MNHQCNPARTLLVWSIRGYQTVISPALPRSCKYYPSCSQYAIDALTKYGVFRGSVLAAWRLLRCNPLSYGGYDPVDRQTLFGPRTKVDETPGLVNGEAVPSTRRAGSLNAGLNAGDVTGW